MRSLAPDQILAKVIRAYMGLPDERVVIYNQNWPAPKDADLYITISLQDSNPLGVKQETEITPQAATETSSAVMFHTFAVEISSRNREAADRKEEVLMALHSQAALRIAEENGVRLWRAGRITDLSFIEGEGALSRYRLTVVMSCLHEKQSPAEIFEHFPEEVTANGA